MIGTQIDNYRILEKIGDGGMGSVYKAVDVMLEREVALKFLRPELASQPDLVERFRSEAIVLAKLHHPNIASLYGLHKHGDDFFMAMEYVRGETLDATIRTSKQLAIPQASDVASSVLGALEYAHSQGIVHRDIKSANIILGPTGCKVMDFGIARVLGTDRRTRVGFVVGTIGYMAPEQIQGMDVDGRADIYALGVVLYEMITGRVPFEGESEWAVMQAQVQQMPVPPRVFASHIPVSLENTVMRALAKQPQDRFQSAVEFQRAIQGALRQSGFHQTTSFIAVPQQEDSMIAAPGDETREHKSNPHLASGEVAVGSGAFVMPPPSPASLTGPQQAFPPPVPRVPTAPAQPVPTPPAAVRPVAAVPAAGAPAQAKAAQAKAASASPAAARRSNAPLIAMLAVVAVVVAGGEAVAWRMWKARAAEVPPAETTQAATDPAATLDPAASVPPPAASVAPTPIVPAPVPPVAPATAKPTTPTPGAATPGAKPPAARPTGRATLTATPLVVETPEVPVVDAPARPELPAAVFGGVRVVTRPGRRAQETSAVLELRGDGLRVRPLGEPERVVAYSTVQSAWFGTLRVDRLVGGDTRHLLFLNVGGQPLVLRLDKANYRTILPALEARSGLKITDRGEVSLADVER